MRALIIIAICISQCAIAKPTKKEVFVEILRQEIAFPEIVWKQAWLESHCGKYSKNLFGFRTKSGYIEFESWKESVTYYKKWQKKRLIAYMEEKRTKQISYYDFIWWVGYKDGKRYSDAGKGYIDYLRRIKFAIK